MESSCPRDSAFFSAALVRMLEKLGCGYVIKVKIRNWREALRRPKTGKRSVDKRICARLNFIITLRGATDDADLSLFDVW